MTPILEPIAAGIAVAIFNKYILNKLDPFGYCYTQCCSNDEEEDCVSSSSTLAASDAFHVRHF